MEKIKLSKNKENFGLTFSDSNYKEFKETRNKNLFENVIDSLMMNKYSDNEELNNYIKGLPNDKKRIALLTTLDGNNNQWNKLKQLVDNKKSITDNIKEIILMLRKFVKVGEVEKKKYGEVMTPLELVKDMLANLPKDVWSNPNLKWLDPANGTGPFPIMVIYKLMEGLKEWEPDEEKRYKHIVENMIYTCELQDRNVFLWLCAVDLEDRYATNTYWGSFLEEEFDNHVKEVWRVDKFDIILGNPPYNGAETGGGNSLWDKFIRKSILYIKSGGNLVFVHPSSWRKPPSDRSKTKDIWKLLTHKNQLIYLEIHSIDDGKKVFNAGTRYDFYCVEINEKYKKSIVIDENGNKNIIDCGDWEFLPNYNFNNIKKLMGNGCEVIFSRSMYATDKTGISDKRTDEYKYPLIHSTPKSGIRYKYCNENRGHFGVSKIIFGESGINHVIIDTKGDYGITNSSIGIKINSIEEATSLKNYLLSEYFKDIIKSCSWGNFRIDWRLFKYFKKDFWK